MAGSYKHCTADDGQLYRNEDFVEMVENLGDAYEAVEEMYGMIWLLAKGDRAAVEEARANYRSGIGLSPGTDGRLSDA